MMAALTHGGVVDTGAALVQAALFCDEASVKLLLQHPGGRGVCWWGRIRERYRFSGHDAPSFVHLRCQPCSPRLARLLIDAGADTTSAVPVGVHRGGPVTLNETPVRLTNIYLKTKKARGNEDAAEQQLKSLEAVRRLLLQVEAVHAVSWLWHSSDAPSIPDPAADGARRVTTRSTPLTLMMPTLRRRAARRSVLLAALCRCVCVGLCCCCRERAACGDVVR